MKYLIIPILIIVQHFTGCSGNSGANNVPVEKYAEIKFESDSINVGVIEAKKIATLEYHFSNTGNIPLKVTYSQGACFCVQPKWPEDSIPPGGKGVLNVSFDPEDVTGNFIRTLYVVSNSKRDTVGLMFYGDIQPKSK